MHLNKNELQAVLNQFGNVMGKYNHLKELAVASESSDLRIAVEQTDDEINAFKRLIAASIQQTGLKIVQEGDVFKDDGTQVIMPEAIGCDCGSDDGSGN